MTNLVRAESISRALSGDGHIMASRTWLGQRPEGPGAEPLGNDLTHFLIADSGSVRGVTILALRVRACVCVCVSLWYSMYGLSVCLLPI